MTSVKLINHSSSTADWNKLINVNANGCWLITVRFSFKLVVIVLELFPPNSDSGDYKKKVWSC